MNPRNLLGWFAERRRVRHQDPWAQSEMDAFRCRLQRLIQAAKS